MSLCKCNLILQSPSSGYRINFFNKWSMAMKFLILNVHEGLGGLEKDGRCM